MISLNKNHFLLFFLFSPVVLQWSYTSRGNKKRFLVCVKHHFCWDRICPMAEKMKDLWKNVGAAQDECNNTTHWAIDRVFGVKMHLILYSMLQRARSKSDHIFPEMGGSTTFCTAKNIVIFLSIRLNHHLKIIQSDKMGVTAFVHYLILWRHVIFPLFSAFYHPFILSRGRIRNGDQDEE